MMQCREDTDLGDVRCIRKDIYRCVAVPLSRMNNDEKQAKKRPKIRDINQWLTWVFRRP